LCLLRRDGRLILGGNDTNGQLAAGMPLQDLLNRIRPTGLHERSLLLLLWRATGVVVTAQYESCSSARRKIDSATRQQCQYG
jgi:hypothetical protein